MHFKKLLCSLVACSFIAPSVLAAPITITLNAKALTLSDTPILIENRVYLPLRSFSNALGCTAKYDKAEGQVIISSPVKGSFTFPISSRSDGKNALIKNNKAYLPVRMICEDLGYAVKWDGKSQTLSLSKASAIPQTGTQQIALDVAECIKNKDYAPVAALFDETLSAALSTKDLAASFTELEKVLGPIQSYSYLQTGTFDNYEEGDVLLKYSQTTVSLAVVLNEAHQISGIHTNQYTPEISLPDGAVEKELTFASDTAYPLTGTLTLPNQKGNFPVIVLVHGSGPLDRDETVYNTKFFRDLAHGLAEKGIATFRYDKRTFAYAKELTGSTTLTLDEEVMDDALAAIKLMANTANVNSNQVYVLGHSLGAMLIPMLNEKTHSPAGYIMASAPARDLPDVVLEQYKYLTAADATLSEADKAGYMEQVQYFVDAAKNATPSTAGDTLGLAGFNDLFWAALNTYDQQAEAKKITVPTLLTQGERDYQVTMEDFKLWQEDLKDLDNFTLKSYPGLNHLYVSGTKASTPDEYFFDSFADTAYINDVAAWVNAQTK